MAKTIDRSIFAWSLMTGVASLAFMMMGVAGVRAEVVIVQGDNGAAGDPGQSGGDGELVEANAGSVHPITSPLNKATATGGNGGVGGDGANGSNGGNGGAATATAATSIASGSAEADAAAFGGSGGAGGNSLVTLFGNTGTGGMAG